ncbi:PREDICTED: probable receptor-like protein kinase At1g67000 [Fragaria vesca subsp. vesca]|uniref:probable receptor-like protein kinase At1g67000 n=1 Tax=Fragaria vesca subsp. vesca TaxID=101020 RepID=UPI0002C375BE|nr:PREDICTED: probable receptor-like protein kinase At1g67000 [Fragaria vesca subsp. vesca]
MNYSFVFFQSSLIPLLLITSFLSINFRSSVCADTAEYANCSLPVTCGSVKSNISYPFWGSDRPEYCGKSGFEVTCNANVPMITMKKINFRILDMSSSTITPTPTVTVAREDYWNTLCPPSYIDTDLNFSLFEYASGPQNVSFYYGCHEAGSSALSICNSTVTVTFLTEKETAKLPDSTASGSCAAVVLVPVSAAAAEALDKNETSTIQSAVDGGFELNVQDDDTVLCNNCVVSGGFCGQNTTNAEFVCYCQYGTSATTCDSKLATSSSSGDALGLKLGLGAAGLVILVIVVVCCFRKKLSDKFTFFWMNKNHSREIVQEFLKDHGPLHVKRYSYLDVKKMTDSFKEKLGQGGYGGVYKGKLDDGCLVAVKILNRTKGNGEEFMNEVAAISRTSHVNIVRLLGFCFDGSERALIYQYMPNGSLEKFIYDANNPQKNQHLAWEALDRIALGIARGLEYLHRGCNTRILHFDIKPHNILLDENFSPKISDFGLAKICKGNESIVSMLGARGTCGYIAPEVFCRNFGGVSHKSDVYSYGMMLSVMVGGKKNISVEVEDTSEIYFPHWIYKRLELDQELGLQNIMNEGDKVIARKLIIVSLWCIQTNPSNRPSMKQVIEMLEGSVESLQIPPKPYLSSPPKSPAHSSSTTSVSIQ